MHDQIGEAPPTEHAALQQRFLNIGQSPGLKKKRSRQKKTQQGNRTRSPVDHLLDETSIPCCAFVWNTCWSELGMVVAAAHTFP